MKKILIYLVIFSIIFSPIFPGIKFEARAANPNNIVVDAIGLPNANAEALISKSSVPAPILRITISSSTPTSTLSMVAVSFSGTNFQTTDLESLSNDGVALYRDDNGDGLFSTTTDTRVTYPTPSWSGGSTINFYSFTGNHYLRSTSTTFFVTIKTSATANFSDTIRATVNASSISIQESTLVSGPLSVFYSYPYRVEDVWPECTITSNTITTNCQFSSNITINHPLYLYAEARIKNGASINFSTSSPSTSLLQISNGAKLYIEKTNVATSSLIIGTSTVNVMSGGMLIVDGNLFVYPGHIIGVHRDININGNLFNDGSIDYNGSGSGVATCQNTSGGKISGTGLAIGSSTAPMCMSGSVSNPNIIFSDPVNGSSGISPNNNKIFFGFDKPMNTLTINDADASDASSNITLSYGSIKIPGSVNYLSSSADCVNLFGSSTCPVNKYNFGVFISSTTLSTNTNYELKIYNSVTDLNNLPINPNTTANYYLISFNTGAGSCVSNCGVATSSQGAFISPVVEGVIPSSGSVSVPTNSLIGIKFSKPLDATTVNSANIKIYAINSNYADISQVNIPNSEITNPQSNLVIINHDFSNSPNTSYKLKIYGGIKSQDNVPMDAIQTNLKFDSIFKTSSSSDTTYPTIDYTYPANGSINIPITTNKISLFTNKAINPTSIDGGITLTTANDILLTGKIEYDAMSKSINFFPSSALATGTTYYLKASSSISDFTTSNNHLIPTTTTFTTEGTLNNTQPYISSAWADDYHIFVKFNIPMNTDNMSNGGVTNLANIISIKQGSRGTDLNNGGTIVSTTSITASYDNLENRLTLEGFSLPVGNDFRLEFSSSTAALNGQILTGTTVRGPINAQTTSGTVSGTNNNYSTSIFSNVQVSRGEPFNTLIGQTSGYKFDLAIFHQIDNNGYIVLTFPNGFNIGSTTKDANFPGNNDFNYSATGTPTFDPSYDGDGIAVDNNANTVTIRLSGYTNPNGYDRLNFSLANIINSSIPRDYSTSGHKINVVTKNSSGTILENFDAAPFYLQSGGAYSLSGTITATGSVGGNAKIYLSSNNTGIIETTANFNGSGQASYNFTNLQSGNYNLYTDKNIFLNTSKEYFGITPLNLYISSSTTKNFSLISSDNGTPVVINISGPANEALKIFANNYNNYRSTSITLDGSGQASTTVYLSNGDWNIGAGRDDSGLTSSTMNPPNFIMPKPKNLNVTNPNCFLNGATSSCTISFNLVTADKIIEGTVIDQDGKIMSNADVWAYDPMAGFGTFAKADAEGKFNLKLTSGKFKVGANIPGMPPSKEYILDVLNNASGTIMLDGANVPWNASGDTTNDFKITIIKPSLQISGTVTDANNGLLSGVSVWAYRTDGSGYANAVTGSDGKYILYVSPGNWKINTYLPDYGVLPEKSVNITDSNQNEVNFSPNTSGETYYRISGEVGGYTSDPDGHGGGYGPISGAFIYAESTQIINGTKRNVNTKSDADGNYYLSVPEGTYNIYAYHPYFGKFSPILNQAISSNLSGLDLSVADARTVNIIIKDTLNNNKVINEAYIDFYNQANQNGNHIKIASSSSGNLKLEDGIYNAHVNIPGIFSSNITLAGLNASTTVNNNILTVDGTENVIITIPSLVTVSGNIVDASSTPITNAWVELTSTSTGVKMGTLANPNYSLDIPAGNYSITAMKPGYFSNLEAISISTSTTKNIIMTDTNSGYTISGSITTTIGTTTASSSFAFVKAEKIENNEIKAVVGNKSDASGSYAIKLNAGTWKLYAVTENYREKAYASNPITVSANQSDVNFNFTESDRLTFASPVNQPITPSQGGTVNAPDLKIRLTIPANALNSNNDNGNISVKETSNIYSSATAKPLGGKGREISATDANGQAINNLNDSISIEMDYSKSELDIMLPEVFGSTTWDGYSNLEKFNNLKKLQLSYWDETSGTWIERPSTMEINPATSTLYSQVTGITLKGDTDHFTIFAVIMPFLQIAAADQNQGNNNNNSNNNYSGGGSSYNYQAPATTTATTTKISFCSAVSYDTWSGCVNNWQTRTIKTQTPSGCILTLEQINAKKQKCGIEEKKEPNIIKKEAEKVIAKIIKLRDYLLGKLGLKRNLKKEQEVLKKYMSEVIKKAQKITKDDNTAIKNFIAYGTKDTAKLKDADRAKVVTSYKTAFSKLPTKESEWQDVEKISLGKAPQEKNKKTETNAGAAFKKIYRREPNLKKAPDFRAFMTIAYGLLPTKRDLRAEKAAINKFIKIYRYTPKTDAAWNIVNAIAYSGAK